jgi:hypothetical protein
MNLDDSFDPFEDMAQLSQAIKFAFRRGKNWEVLPPESKEALELIATDLARILVGNLGEPKHWDDIAALARIRNKTLEQKTLETSVAQVAKQRINLFEAAPRASLGDA